MPVSYGSFEISDDQPLLQQLATDVMAATGGGVSDGDKGDIVVSGGGNGGFPAGGAGGGGVGSNTGTGVGGNGAVYVISW